MAKISDLFTFEKDRELFWENHILFREALFSCRTEEQVECAVAFARYLSKVGITSENHWLFLRLLYSNNPWVIDELLYERDPRLLFSTVPPYRELADAAFNALYARHPEEIYEKALLSFLGIIENTYFDPDDGYRIRKITIADINTLGKFLIKHEPQEHPQNFLILDILDKLAHLGEYYQEQDKFILSNHAFRVRYAYFDSTRDLVDAIPHTLLVRLADKHQRDPDFEYAELLIKRRTRKRDERGRFVKETAPLPEPMPEKKINAEIEQGLAKTNQNKQNLINSNKVTKTVAQKTSAKSRKDTGTPKKQSVSKTSKKKKQ